MIAFFQAIVQPQFKAPCFHPINVVGLNPTQEASI
jgi:hypothetical protein